MALEVGWEEEVGESDEGCSDYSSENTFGGVEGEGGVHGEQEDQGV